MGTSKRGSKRKSREVIDVEMEEVSLIDEVAGPSVPKVNPKPRSTKSLGPGHRKEPAYKSRRKTITTLGAVDIIPSLPEDEPTDSGKKRLSERQKKKYIPVKKKTSVKIDY